MKLILVGDNLAANQSFSLGPRAIYAIAGLLFFVCVSLFSLGYYIASPHASADQGTDTHIATLSKQWREQLDQQALQIDKITQQSEFEVNALSIRLAQLQARLLRMEAVGERIAQVAKLDRGEFDFSQAPAVGGPEDTQATGQLSHSDVDQALQGLQAQVADRSEQLAILESFLANRKIDQDGYLAGRPIKKGWLSSHYGKRVDPFKGHIAWHKGVDFAGKEDADIIAVASGVVTWSGERYGYGNMVEVNHGNGYVTRYAHNKTNLVAVGDIVKKGVTLAKMGSTGRSTGPHVHFEVYKNGRAVDPKRYIYRRHRG